MNQYNLILLIAALFLTSEVLSMAPGLKSKGVMQFFWYLAAAIISAIQKKEV